MNNEMTKTSSQLMTPASSQASLLDMRADAKRFPRIGTFSREQAVLEMSKIVSQAFLYRGQAVDLTNIQFISSALVDELLEDDKYGAGYLSLAEIQVVVKRAVLGGSEMFGISVASLYKVIMEFVKGEGHRNQQQVLEQRKKDTERILKESALAPMLQAYKGEFIRNNKINK